MKTQPINAQTAGPLAIAPNDAIYAYAHTCRIMAIRSDGNRNVRVAETYDGNHAPNARLLVTSFNAFDKAGRELGIDAATLAERIDLAALIRTLEFYANRIGGAKARAIVANLQPE